MSIYLLLHVHMRAGVAALRGRAVAVIVLHVVRRVAVVHEDLARAAARYLFRANTPHVMSAPLSCCCRAAWACLVRKDAPARGCGA